MKKAFKSILAIALGAIAFASCEVNPDALQTVAGEQTIEFVAEEMGTRAAFTLPDGNSYPVVWSANDTLVKLALNFTGAKDATVEPSADGKTARIVTSATDTLKSYTFYALAPMAAYVGQSTNNKSWTIGIPSTQTPTANSVDPAALVIVGKAGPYATLPESSTMQFEHAIAYGKMTLTGLDIKNGATLTGVTLLSEVNIAGRWNYFVEDNGTNKAGDVTANSATNVIAINTGSATDIWFGIAPVDMSGKKMAIIAKTTDGTYSRTVTFPADRKFEVGKIATFSVDMSTATYAPQKKYELVKNVADLTPGSQVVIAAKDFDYAVSTTQNSNNRAAAGIAKEGDFIVDPNPNVEVFEVETGAAEGTFAFRSTDTDGYIYAAGGTGTSNYMKTTKTKDVTSSWTVTITDTGKATIKCAESTVKRNTLMFNDGSSIFSCYASNQKDVVIYKNLSPDPVKADPELKLENTTLSVKVGESAEIGIDGCKSAGAITYSTSDDKVATVDEDGMVYGIAAGTATITVSVAETEDYRASSATCKVTVTSAGTTTIADVLAGNVGMYSLNAVTVNAVGGPNIIIADASGKMLVYLSGNELAAGDVINITGYTKDYNNFKEFYTDSSHDLTITKVSSGATVNHGTPVAFAESNFEAYASAPDVQYISFNAIIPVTGYYAKVGNQSVNLNGSWEDNGRYATFYGYTAGYNKNSTYTYFVITSYTVDSTKPFISVDQTEKVWKCDETDAFTVNVTCENGAWEYEATTMDWADISVSGNALTVTPKAANTTPSTYEGKIVVKHSSDAAQNRTVTFKQTAPAGNSFTITSDDIKKAHTASWSYTSGKKEIVATDGSKWTCFNTYASSAQATIQMNKGRSSYVLTPEVPAGKTISHLTITCATNAEGTKLSGATRTFDITDNGTAVISDISGEKLTAGVNITGSHTQLKIAPNETNGGACYIVNITVDFK